MFVELVERGRPEAGLVWIAEEDGKPVRYTSEPASFWKRFAAGLPANNVLLWGARGTGKSALVKAAHAAVNEARPEAREGNRT